ncbi:TOMM precursor leader peptide-binding protein [Paenibacillus larvae]|uniref:TOMM precursor leader peptide-binding protein n=1 Tax=Paenibacillus larvae TaxID=1464 RepID=UPI00227E1DDE|nr:TOMM precursor leader peptide-binding protein [Paenibacillus larvae]MCY9512068.1 TOMM precursor leader peptide-binding protein [Paenibacillus larvae]MCY9527148.1 TOMM precursor leader peptide-binding protein [Paenibacillus larvae]
MKAVVIIGEGLLADFVHSELSGSCQVIRQTNFMTEMPREAELVLLLRDSWHPSAFHDAEKLLHNTGVSWIRGFISFGEGVIGPLVQPNKPGCSQCADMRRMLAGSDRKEMSELQLKTLALGKVPRDVWASRTGLLHLSYLLTAEVQRVLQGSPACSEGRVYLINLKTLESSLHFFLPDPQCSFCGQLPDDSSESAQIALQPSPKASADSYRTRSMVELKDVLARDYLDTRTGLMNGKMVDLKSAFSEVSVNLPLFMGDEVTAGRTHSYSDSEMTAIMEGLERYCGLTPRGKRTSVHDSFRNLSDQALNPVQVGVYTKEQYAQPDFPFEPFDPDRSIDWVWGYSFLREQPILVPELLAYYSMGCGNGLVYETSNGCALGGSLEEAIFYGILEVVERDAFLMTWYAQLPLPRLDPISSGDPELQMMVERLLVVAGYDVLFFNATMENRIPSIWALAKNRKQKGMNLICAAGSHPDPVRAAKSSVHELAALMLALDDKLEANKDEYVRMLYDSSLVRQMEDHSMLYGLRESEERLNFLLDDNCPMYTFAEAFGQKKQHADLTDDLKDIIEAFRGLNLDVIVVDQSTPEIVRNGLHCVKVLIPGMLPMTFGHHLIRLAGLDRVLRVPMELGYVKEPLSYGQLNPYPHPFP